MIGSFREPFPFNNDSVSRNAPDSMGVYYCGKLKTDNVNALSPVHYVGMSGESIKGRLQDHIRKDNWPDVTHFGFEV